MKSESWYLYTSSFSTHQLNEVDQARKCSRMQTRNVALSEKRESIFNGNLAPRPNTGKYFCPRCKLSWRPRLKHLREICFGTSNCRGMDQCCSLVCMLVGPLASGGLKGCLQQALGQQLDISKYELLYILVISEYLKWLKWELYFV